ncbi:hypothetical protein MKS88_000589 [Plasmodium brasilianum]|uniref:Uncharacterized protein n=1 Tax=Plasmodium brasilianum TaxID=5824 RepID=A0ACB9YFI9_PLABR|nr:hypothetical protein MKS88_000589 [Plasmodium brasilianum]
MAQEIKLLLFIKIVEFIFLIWLFPFYSDMNMFDMLREWNNFNIILYLRNYRSLENYGREIYYNIREITNDESYRKLKCRKYGLRFSLLLIFFLLVLMIPILDISFTYVEQNNGLFGEMCLLNVHITRNFDSLIIGGYIKIVEPIAKLFGLKITDFPAVETAVSILFNRMTFFSSAIIIILEVVYYYKNFIKNQKIKLKEIFYQ